MIGKIVGGDTAAPFTCSHWYATNYAHVANGRTYIGTDGGVCGEFKSIPRLLPDHGLYRCAADIGRVLRVWKLFLVKRQRIDGSY